MNRAYLMMAGLGPACETSGDALGTGATEPAADAAGTGGGMPRGEARGTVAGEARGTVAGEARGTGAGEQGVEDFARALMNGEGFRRYVERHGYHFTPELADEVTARYLENADGSAHRWTTEQVKNAMMAVGMTRNPLGMTWGDAAWLANWYYSDEYPEVIGTEKGCIERAYRAAQDPDGYEGMTFMRWLSDVVGHGWRIEWGRFA